MTREPIQAGSAVESTCRKCKAVTDHHVVVMVDDAIGKVQCTVCGGRHAYRPPKIATKSKPKSKPSRAVKSKQAAPAPAKKPSVVLEHWEKMVGTVSGDKVVPYAMSSVFQAGDVIDHKTFGLGYVQKLPKPHMIEVLFCESVKNLRCG